VFIELKPITNRHVHALYALVDENRDHLPNLKWAATVDFAGMVQFIKNAALLREDLRGIYLDRELIGIITLRSTPDALVPASNKSIGYWLDHRHRGKGIMTRAVQLMLAECTVPVAAQVKVGNVISKRVIQKNGFRCIDRYNGWEAYLWVPKNEEDYQC
jgi:RimJ/RimL family protein N-acetyltransferase